MRWVVPLLLTLSAPALAVDGVLEINQTCAVNTGCFTGDAAGFPVNIPASGSYRLTSNLTVSATDANAVEITEKGVTIDLNGFAITGPRFCPASQVCEAPTVTGIGVNSTEEQARLMNGIIRGFLFGIQLKDDSKVIRVEVSESQGAGIKLKSHSQLIESISTRNGGDGVVTQVGNVLSRNVISTNSLAGIFGGPGNVVEGNSIQTNGRGIDIGGGCLIRGNTVGNNLGTGVKSGDDCMVLNNSLVKNAIFNPGQFQLELGVSGYRGNIVVSGSAMLISGGVNLGDNLCDGVACP